MSDNLYRIYNKFAKQRGKPLFGRFPQKLRAVVVDTNDPLRMGRVRFKCPELHDFDVKDEDTQWALPSSEMGGRGCGSWHTPMINDWIWIEFEKGHPYAPLWTGYADPTRRSLYVLDVLSGPTPLPVKKENKPELDGEFNIDQLPQDYDERYFPADQRPMTHGWKDRYGNIMVLNSFGFFPKEHDIKAVNAGQDAVAESEFNAAKAKPVKNEPDMKFMTTITKYGTMVVSADIGYDWEEEFKGDFDEDGEFEIKRANYLREQISEKEPKGRDQRRYEVRTRYGHKFEMRDAGWTKSREKEYEDERKTIGTKDRDERWIKFRSKGGHLIQLWDKNYDEEVDGFMLELLKEERGGEVDGEEDGIGWKNDGRQLRFVSRYGYKIALDDRGSGRQDPTKPKDSTHHRMGSEAPRGNGILIKGRRNKRGHAFEFNEKDDLNHILMYSEKSKVLELNDKEDFIMLCTDMKGKISEPWLGLADNEFALNNAMVFDPESDTFHLKLDKKNKYLRLNTPQGQGIEARDDGNPARTWVEVKDKDDRGFWMCKDTNWSVLRSKAEKTIFMMILDDASNKLLIQNDEVTGLVQIYCENNVEIIAKKDVRLKGRNIHIKADSQVILQGGGRQFVVGPGQVGSAGHIDASQFNGHFPRTMPGGGANSPSPVPGTAKNAVPDKKDRSALSPLPFDQSRGKVTNKPQKPVDVKVIRS